jgi:hypothetical protein
LVPVPIPAELIPPGGQRAVIAPPGGDLTNDDIRAVEAVLSLDGGPCYRMLIEVEEKDLEVWGIALPEGWREQGWRLPRFWLFSFGPHLHPFAIETGGA